MKTLVAVAVIVVVLGITGAWGAETESKLNVCTATAEQLDTLPGIGPKKAQAIIQYRQLHGCWAEIKLLVDVVGIGPKTMDKIHNKITVSVPAPVAPVPAPVVK